MNIQILCNIFNEGFAQWSKKYLLLFCTIFWFLLEFFSHFCKRAFASVNLPYRIKTCRRTRRILLILQLPIRIFYSIISFQLTISEMSALSKRWVLNKFERVWRLWWIEKCYKHSPSGNSLLRGETNNRRHSLAQS